jgi:hypothetical protein
VRLDAVEQQVTSLLEEGVNREVESVEGRIRRDLHRLFFDVGQRGREGNLGLLRRGGDLVQKGSQEMRVMDSDGELDKYILVAQLGFLKTDGTQSQQDERRDV